MKINTIFTEYNPDITADLSRDPLGMQIIWSYFGQQIFNYKLTTVSNDFRNYTINLFHHYLIKKLFEDNIVHLNKKYTNRLELIRGLIIFLENIFIFTITQNKNSSFEEQGIIGSSKAKEKWAGEDTVIQIINTRENEILKNQISLGLNGRYKGPFIQMNIFDRHYRTTLKSNDNVNIWNSIEELFNSKSNQWAKKIQSLSRELTFLIDKTYNKPKTYPAQIKFSEIENIKKLNNLYAYCFGSSLKIDDSVRKFWMSKMGLDDGAAGELYKTVAKILKQKNYDKNKYAEVFSNVDFKKLNNNEKNKIISIQIIEPFLAKFVYAFDNLLQRNIKETEQLNDLGDVLGSLKINILAVETVVKTVNRNYENVKKRLEKLVKIVHESNNTSQFLQNVIAYHKKEVMERRGSIPWVTLKPGTNQIIHSFTSRGNVREEVYEWVHSYYIESLISICLGMSGEL